MRKLQSLIALFGVIAITGAFSSPSAKATVLTSDVHALKAEQTSFVDKAYYRRTIIVAIIAVAFMAVVIMADTIAVVITATAIITAVAGGAMAIATVAGGTKSQRLRNQKRQELIPGAFFMV